MSFDVKLEAYLLTYWSDSNLILAKANIITNISYHLIIAEFETKNMGLETIPFRYDSKDIGTAQLSYSVDYIEDNLFAIHKELRRKLIDAKKLKLGSGPDKYCFARIENVTKLEETVISVCKHLIYSYASGQISNSNPSN